MFLSKFEFNISARPSKIEKWSTFILLPFIYVFITFFYFNLVYFTLFCLFFSPKLFGMRVGRQTSLKNQSNWWLPVYLSPFLLTTNLYDGQVSGEEIHFRRLLSSGSPEWPQDWIKDYCLNLHFVPKCQGLRQRPSNGNMENSCKGWEEVPVGIVE